MRYDEDDDGYYTSKMPRRKHRRSRSSLKSVLPFKIPIKRYALIYAGVLGTAILLLGWMELRIGGPFMILPVHNADVRPETDGIIEEIYVTEGQKVEVGDIIARLSDRDVKSELRKIEALIGQTRARLTMFEVGPTREELALARTAVARARERLKFVRARSDRNKLLVGKGMISRMEFETSQEQTAIAEGDLTEAQNRLTVLQVGTRQEQIDATKAEMASLDVQRRHLEGTLQRVEVRSPAAGLVATPARQLEAMLGQAIQKGALVAKVYDFKRLMVEIAVSEKDISEIRVGQEVAFKARAYPDETFYGRVTSTATTALGSASTSSNALPVSITQSSTSSPTTILVTTVIDNRGLKLKPGMTGQAKIFCGERRIISLIARRVARIVKVEFWSWW